MKSQDFRRPAHHDFAKLIYEAGGNGGYRIYDLFGAFLFLAYAALRQAVYKLQTGEINGELEAEYLQQIKRYSNPSKFAEAFGALVNGLEEESHDFLGDVYQALGMADKDFAGQCFTPACLSEMMAEMNIGNVEPNPEKRLAIGEPCIGGGAIAIAVAKVLRKKGFGPRNWFLWGTDVATACFHMSYIQLTLLGVPAIITRGNSLWPKDTDTHAPTFLAALYPWHESQRGFTFDTLSITARVRPRPVPITARTRPRL